MSELRRRMMMPQDGKIEWNLIHQITPNSVISGGVLHDNVSGTYAIGGIISQTADYIQVAKDPWTRAYVDSDFNLLGQIRFFRILFECEFIPVNKPSPWEHPAVFDFNCLANVSNGVAFGPESNSYSFIYKGNSNIVLLSITNITVPNYTTYTPAIIDFMVYPRSNKAVIQGSIEVNGIVYQNEVEVDESEVGYIAKNINGTGKIFFCHSITTPNLSTSVRIKKFELYNLNGY